MVEKDIPAPIGTCQSPKNIKGFDEISKFPGCSRSQTHITYEISIEQTP